MIVFGSNTTMSAAMLSAMRPRSLIPIVDAGSHDDFLIACSHDMIFLLAHVAAEQARERSVKPRMHARRRRCPQSHAIDVTGSCRILIRSSSAPKRRMAPGSPTLFEDAHDRLAAARVHLLHHRGQLLLRARQIHACGPPNRAAIASSASLTMRARVAGSAKRFSISGGRPPAPSRE
jgi:hypothetical protein